MSWQQPVDSPTLADALAFWARGNGRDRVAVRFTPGDGTWAGITYGRLHDAADELGGRLAAIRDGRYGGRFVLIALPSGLGYVLSLYACLLAGVTAVPFYPQGLSTGRAGSAFSRRLREIVADCDPGLVIGTHDVLAVLPAGIPGYLMDGVRAVPGNDVALPGPVRRLRPEPGDLALLQYTSGSTAVPKGVMVTHGNLVHNVSGIARRLRSAPGESATSWLPLFHDMGLIGMLAHPLWAGMTVHLMPPTAFLRRPLSWLETVSATGSAITMAPDFAYALAARHGRRADLSGLDLSGLRHAITAAEPIRLATVTAFSGAFAVCGLRPDAVTPGYGLAENTLCVAAADRSTDPLTVRPHPGQHAIRDRTLVGVGRGPFTGTRTAVVDPATHLRCPQGTTGEIWVTGTSVAAGYWRRQAATEQTFGARIPDEPERWLRTGDLGVVVDGVLCVDGRLKDLVIRSGANIHLHDLELTAADSHPALLVGGGAAFAVGGGTEAERIVVVRELATHADRVDRGDVMRRIRQAIAEEHGVVPDVVALVRRGAIPRTTSGKVRRDACARAWTTGELVPLASWTKAGTGARQVTEQDILRTLTTALRVELALPAERDVDVDAAFIDLGLDSAGVEVIAGELADGFLAAVPAETLFDHPTPRRLAAWLAGELAARVDVAAHD